ncbi:hypothetical protein CFY87_00840 [Actinobacillus seminis]|uniref:Uncharacterized protein n=1 Tax=Actinobacillus seminis TaxID=722 RepID=A0A263HFD1_9PAST|nr:hypothetical protein [Actinobacillus seminis]OZN25792.1 hypothetical protein CFY87_00840 [Actinobacillus seminis]SUU34755.1 Uncharacterised protein [Actinobacillus seminis]
MIRAEDLSQNLLLQISNLIDGNQVGAKELRSGEFRAENVQVAATVSWQFQCEYKEIREVSDKQVKNHFSHDLHNFPTSNIYCNLPCTNRHYVQNF